MPQFHHLKNGLLIDPNAYGYDEDGKKSIFVKHLAQHLHIPSDSSSVCQLSIIDSPSCVITVP